MMLFSRSTTNVLLCLTALAMPLQAVWSSSCECCSAARPAAATPSESTGECCGQCPDTMPKPGCCTEDDSPKGTCCGKTSEPQGKTGCQCGTGCRCYKSDETPSPSPLPAPDNGRSRSVVELAVSDVAAIHVPVAPDRGNAAGGDCGSVFFQPGAHVCVLLCRFTL